MTGSVCFGAGACDAGTRFAWTGGAAEFGGDFGDCATSNDTHLISASAPEQIRIYMLFSFDLTYKTLAQLAAVTYSPSGLIRA
jgi:hypothetical protein